LEELLVKSNEEAAFRDPQMSIDEGEANCDMLQRWIDEEHGKRKALRDKSKDVGGQYDSFAYQRMDAFDEEPKVEVAMEDEEESPYAAAREWFKASTLKHDGGKGGLHIATAGDEEHEGSDQFLPLDESSLLMSHKLGSKTANLISYLKHIKATDADDDSDTRCLIFTQFSWMMKHVSSSLSQQGISNLFCQGNVHVRRQTIQAFQDEGFEDSKKSKKKPVKCIMLSLENAASGTNLTRATHVVLIEPVGGTKAYATATEAQAIGRAHRQGGQARKFPLKVVRFVMRGTGEQDLYIRNFIDS
jgi:SNF2 family DNA or RNA helicase